jgi:hypothetical protein
MDQLRDLNGIKHPKKIINLFHHILKNFLIEKILLKLLIGGLLLDVNQIGFLS